MTNTVESRGSDLLSLVIKKSLGATLRVQGFTNDDDSVQMRELEDSVTYTRGAAGATSINLNGNAGSGEVVIKLLESSGENAYMSNWFKETLSGIINPATIIASTANYRHTAFNCLPVKAADVQPNSKEDPGVEWRFLATKVSLHDPLQETTG